MSDKDIIVILTKEEATKLRKPRYDAYVCGHGAHGSRKYDRNKVKRQSFSDGW